MYVPVLFNALSSNEPLVAGLPVQAPLFVAPLAVQAVAFVDDHVKVDEALYATVDGLAVSVTVGSGAGCTVTVTD